MMALMASGQYYCPVNRNNIYGAFRSDRLSARVPMIMLRSFFCSLVNEPRQSALVEERIHPKREQLDEYDTIADYMEEAGSLRTR